MHSIGQNDVNDVDVIVVGDVIEVGIVVHVGVRDIVFLLPFGHFFRTPGYDSL